MKKAMTLLGLLLISSTSFTAQQCNFWSKEATKILADLQCEISRPNEFPKKFTLSVLEHGACQIVGLGSIPEFATLRITNADGMNLTVQNEQNYELLQLDISSHVKNRDSFYFKLSFPQKNSASKYGVVGCKVQAPEISN
jgi:hypothetical protein